MKSKRKSKPRHSPKARDMQTFFLHPIRSGIRLVMPMYGDTSEIEPATARVFMKLMNGKATVTRFFDIGDGYIHAEAVYHGKFNRKKFAAFLKHWRADIEPVMVKDSALKHWHQSRKREVTTSVKRGSTKGL